MTTSSQPQVVVVANPKNVGVAILLTVLLGPLGMFYSTVGGAILMLIIALIVGFLTLGIGALLTWPICIIWAALAASAHNKRLSKP